LFESAFIGVFSFKKMQPPLKNGRDLWGRVKATF